MIYIYILAQISVIFGFYRHEFHIHIAEIQLYVLLLKFENNDIQTFIHPNIYRSFVPVWILKGFGTGFDFNNISVKTAIFRDEKINIENNSLTAFEINREFREKIKHRINPENTMSLFQQRFSIDFGGCPNIIILIADEKHDQFDVDYHYIRCVCV